MDGGLRRTDDGRPLQRRFRFCEQPQVVPQAAQMKGGPGRFPARCFVQFDRPQVSLGGFLVPAHAFEALAQAVVRGRKAGRKPDNRRKLFRRLLKPLIEIKNFRQREAVILFGGMLLDQTLQFGPAPSGGARAAKRPSPGRNGRPRAAARCGRSA